MSKKKTKKLLRAIQKRVGKALAEYDMETDAVYVFVRKDIPIFAQAVQVGHACLEAGRLFHDDFSRHTSHLVLLRVKDEWELEKVMKVCSAEDARYHCFFEPDRDSLGGEDPSFTALCTEPLLKKDWAEVFESYELWNVQ